MENTIRPKRPLLVYGFFGFLALLMVAWIVVNLVRGTEWATMQEGDAEIYMLRVADNPLERARGLAGTEPSDLGDAVGMVFVYDDAADRTFTMKGMNYNLDFYWLRDGKIMRIDENVAAPKAGEDPVTVSSYPLDVDMVIEMPAGTARTLQYIVSQDLKIDLDASK